MREVFVRFPEFAATARPGPVNGMRPGHEPMHGSWARDARAHLHELRGYLSPSRINGAPSSTSKTKTKKRAPREEAAPIEWALRDRARTMRVVLFGGAPCEDARANIQRVLGIGELDWPESNRPRKVEALAVGLKAGRYDVLLVTRFVHHKDSKKLISAAQAGGTPFAIVDSGYGVEAARQALEGALRREVGSRARRDWATRWPLDHFAPQRFGDDDDQQISDAAFVPPDLWTVVRAPSVQAATLRAIPRYELKSQVAI